MRDTRSWSDSRCWLLMIHDRVGGENLKLTQEAIASRLGARRAESPSLRECSNQLHAIEYRRGQLHIKDQCDWKKCVCECYEILKAEYEAVKS